MNLSARSLSDRLAELAPSAEDIDGPDPAPRLVRGERIARYVILDVLGEGNMGVVYAAYDPELDRKVAVKVLTAPVSEPGAVEQERLRREARALARLTHPNVVAVHDAGIDAGRVWLAMELVRGLTLDRWVSGDARRRSELYSVLTGMAAGLAAAHAKDIVHRDLKQTNVMVGDDGRARVMDFGLAHVRAREATDPATMTGADPPAAATVTSLTCGTPLYMAPEQWLGADVGPPADQFAWCVLAWELLYGEHPFAGMAYESVRRRVIAGTIPPPPPRRGVPPWLRRLLARGLSLDPKKRWPSMQAVIDELSRGQRRSSSRRIVGAAAVAGIVACGGWASFQAHTIRKTRACEAAGAQIDAFWYDARASVREGLVATGASYAGVTADKVLPWLDRHAEAWRSARTELCVDTDVRGTWAPEMAERALWCLDERRMAFESLVDELSHADGSIVQRAMHAATALPRVEACSDARQLAQLPLPPTDRRDELQAVRSGLSQSYALESTGRYEEGLATAQELAERASALQWPPLHAAVQNVRGNLLERNGRYAEAEAVLEQAYFEAVRAGALEVAAEASMRLVTNVGDDQRRPAEGLRWAKHAEVALSTLGDQTYRAAKLAFRVATVHRSKGEYSESKRLHLHALRLLEESLGPDHLELAASYNNFALLLVETGDYSEAKRMHERSLRITELSLGSEHPLVATSLNNLGIVSVILGQREEAEALYERALDIYQRMLGPDHPDLGYTFVSLAHLAAESGQTARAKELYERALTLWTRAYGDMHPNVAHILSGLAGVHSLLNEFVEARRLYLRALAIHESTLGPDRQEIGSTLSHLGEIHHLMGEHSQARAVLSRALEIQEKALGDVHPDLSTTLGVLGITYMELGEFAAATRTLERALAIAEAAIGRDHRHYADLQLALADVCRHTGELVRAKQLYERALGTHQRALGPRHPDVADSLVGLSLVSLTQRDAAAAVPLARRAVEISDDADGLSDVAGLSRFVLARALWDSNLDRGQARTLAHEAHRMIRANAGPRQREELAEIRRWLATHTRSRAGD